MPAVELAACVIEAVMAVLVMTEPKVAAVPGLLPEPVLTRAVKPPVTTDATVNVPSYEPVPVLPVAVIPVMVTLSPAMNVPGTV